MNDDKLLNTEKYQDLFKSYSPQMNLPIAQERIYKFFVKIVKQWTPEAVLQEFKRLFIDCLNTSNTDEAPGLYAIFFADKEDEFRHTLKRCCYIIINNWENNRKSEYIAELIDIFNNYHLTQKKINYEKISICETWIDNFIKSQDYEKLKTFAIRYETRTKGNWARRYTTYLLAAESVDDNNSKEQQEAARVLYRKMRDKFKFDLAMYITHCQSTSRRESHYKNPTILGDNVLRLIKMIIAKRGTYSYENIANIFIQQTENQTLGDFKESLQKYLVFSVNSQQTIEDLKENLLGNLSSWKVDDDDEIITKELFLRCCNRVIDCLTTDNSKEPSPIFISLLCQGHSLTLVIILLKIILICKNCRTHLEMRIANLINYYEKYPADECQWLIQFIEIFNIALAIYAENIEYNLIYMKVDEQVSDTDLNLDSYRVFSQWKTNF